MYQCFGSGLDPDSNGQRIRTGIRFQAGQNCPQKIGITEKKFFMFEEFCIGLDLSFSSLVLIAKI
jgi:hypothetical protein